MKAKMNKNKLYWRSAPQHARVPESTEHHKHAEMPACCPTSDHERMQPDIASLWDLPHFAHEGGEKSVDEMFNNFALSSENRQNLPSRRRFLSLMSASLALAGLSACRKPVERILPYVKGLEESVPGIPLHYASTMPRGLHSSGVLVTTFDGRPTKIEGLVPHPSSQGASDIHMQAAILNLYDPDRSHAPHYKGAPSDWNSFLMAWREQQSKLLALQGEGFAVLSTESASPTFLRLQKALIKTYPKMMWVTWDSVSDESILSAAEIACGAQVQPVVHFDKAQVILCLDSDALCSESEALANARGFAAGRTVSGSKDSMNRLYVVEPSMTITGGAADHRLRLKAGRIAPWALALAAELGRQGLRQFADIADSWPAPDFNRKWLSAVAMDLLAHRGKSLIMAGRRQPVELHLLLFAINMALDNVDNAISFVPLEQITSSSTAALARLIAEMAGGSITHLAIVGGNPAYSCPADLGFAEALHHVPFSLHLGDRLDETSAYATWHLPSTHFLEEWGDARCGNGRLSAIQPMIEPLFGGKSAIELLELLAGGNERKSYELVRETWQAILPIDLYEKAWRQLLHDGIFNTMPSPTIKPSFDLIEAHIQKHPVPDEPGDQIEVCFQPSALHDGCWANNAWLQELPDPITKIAWDNPARISLSLARKFGLANGDMVRLHNGGRRLEMPVWVVPGQADNSITLELGYGRTRCGQVGDSVGFDVQRLRTSLGMGFAQHIRIEALGKSYPIACAQEHDSMEGRPLVREASLAQFREHPQFAREAVEELPMKSLWKEHTYNTGYQWGMVIDLNACIGCNACTIACQSENNIPVVGKEQVMKGREMHWIRLDRYFSGEFEEPEMVHQPVACHHCENAPCEQVCPVAATIHDHEGLNVMAYNRCVGTRYCSNNCPFKARRFNFFDYTSKMDDLKKMAQNPDVTVRMRGVMEKCTYCLQRLTLAKNKAKLEGRVLADGEVMTACQQACPTQAITFGNLLDPKSRVAAAKSLVRSYDMLGELNIRPRTSFSAKLRNRNPELA